MRTLGMTEHLRILMSSATKTGMSLPPTFLEKATRLLTFLSIMGIPLSLVFMFFFESKSDFIHQLSWEMKQ
ncbi:hypothetical protein LINPERPRIM_LOCUS17350 [Linum perenne]